MPLPLLCDVVAVRDEQCVHALPFVSHNLLTPDQGALGTVISSYTTSWDLCLYAQYTCILMYGASKVFLYLFLGTVYPSPRTKPCTDGRSVEKVHLVWVSLNSHRRCKSRVYILCIACTIFYPPYVVCILAFKGWWLHRTPKCHDLICSVPGFTADVHPDGHCYIGLRNFISIPIIVYDLYAHLSLFLNVLINFFFQLSQYHAHHPLCLAPLAEKHRQLSRQAHSAPLTYCLRHLSHCIHCTP